MKSREGKSAYVVRTAEEISLPAPALVELMKAVLARGVSFRFRARGFSMTPFVRDGDVITVSPLSKRPIGTGEIVAYTHEKTGKLVVHRVIRKRGGAYLVRGDNARAFDELVPKRRLLGCVTAVERKGRKIRLGLGPERFLIALLNQHAPVMPILGPVWRWLKPLVKSAASGKAS